MKRYNMEIVEYGEEFFVQEEMDVSGTWVRWEDVKEIVEEYQKIINEGQEDINYL